MTSSPWRHPERSAGSRLRGGNFKVASGASGVTLLALFSLFKSFPWKFMTVTDYFRSHKCLSGQSSPEISDQNSSPLFCLVDFVSASLCTVLPLSVCPYVTGLPTHKPLLCIIHASFILSPPCPPTAFADSNPGWPSAGLCRARAKTGRGNRRYQRRKLLATMF